MKKLIVESDPKQGFEVPGFPHFLGLICQYYPLKYVQ